MDILNEELLSELYDDSYNPILVIREMIDKLSDVELKEYLESHGFDDKGKFLSKVQSFLNSLDEEKVKGAIEIFTPVFEEKVYDNEDVISLLDPNTDIDLIKNLLSKTGVDFSKEEIEEAEGSSGKSVLAGFILSIGLFIGIVGTNLDKLDQKHNVNNQGKELPSSKIKEVIMPSNVIDYLKSHDEMLKDINFNYLASYNMDNPELNIKNAYYFVTKNQDVLDSSDDYKKILEISGLDKETINKAISMFIVKYAEAIQGDTDIDYNYLDSEG